MAYIDLTTISDRHAERLIDKDSGLAQLALSNAQDDSIMASRAFGVKQEDIALDSNGYLQSKMLYVYCKWRFLYYLFDSVAGSYELDDIYGQKALKAERQAKFARDDLSYEIITELEVTEPTVRNVGIPIL